MARMRLSMKLFCVATARKTPLLEFTSTMPFVVSAVIWPSWAVPPLLTFKTESSRESTFAAFSKLRTERLPPTN